jgi:hypothetical protein
MMTSLPLNLCACALQTSPNPACSEVISFCAHLLEIGWSDFHKVWYGRYTIVDY